MGRMSFFALAPVGFLSVAAATSASAAQASQQARVGLAVRQPVSVRQSQDLNFAMLTVTGAGTAIVNPDDSMRTTGRVQYLGGAHYAARFEITAPRLAILVIRLPNAPSTLTRVGGTETMTVSNWTLDGFPIRIIPSNRPYAFNVGGTLKVNAGQADGTYAGEFTVTAEYL
jgi:hypothetical protein